MQTEPSKAEPPKRKRRWFQFSLRTLMIVVTLLAVPLGYVGWQAKIVRERKLAAAELTEYRGAIAWSSGASIKAAGRQLKVSEEVTYKWPFPQVSWLRRLLGDDYALAVDHPRIPDEALDRIKAAFPEAVFVKLYR